MREVSQKHSVTYTYTELQDQLKHNRPSHEYIALCHIDLLDLEWMREGENLSNTHVCVLHRQRDFWVMKWMAISKKKLKT